MLDSTARIAAGGLEMMVRTWVREEASVEQSVFAATAPN
jgi:hypothetical protein